MNKISIFSLKVLRKIYGKIFKFPSAYPFEIISDFDAASEIIYDKLIQDKPCMIGRFGAEELGNTVIYMSVISEKHSAWKYIRGEEAQWWWNDGLVHLLKVSCGVFPINENTLQRFGALMLKDAQELDVLGVLGKDMASWRHVSHYIEKSKKIGFLSLEPFWAASPWTRVLKGKKVLVVSMFAELIKEQYKKRRLLFKNPDVLPDFELITITAVNSYGGQSDHFGSWFDALKWMEDEMDKIDYDVVLLGCGAYGFPLAAHAKRKGKKAVHLGGVIQLLFGIKGKRWENPNYGLSEFNRKGKYLELFNEHWCRPGDDVKPANAKLIEDGCYW